MRGLSRIAGYTGFAIFGALLVTVAVQLRQPGAPASPAGIGSQPPGLQRIAPLPPPPVADFPYVFAGKAHGTDGMPLVLLARDSQLLTLAVGGVIDGRWRVEAIGDDTLELSSVADGKRRQLRYSELTRQGETVRSQAEIGRAHV